MINLCALFAKITASMMKVDHESNGQIGFWSSIFDICNCGEAALEGVEHARPREPRRVWLGDGVQARASAELTLQFHPFQVGHKGASSLSSSWGEFVIKSGN